MPTTPNEVVILRAIVSRLEAATGGSYHYDADSAFLVDRTQVKHLAEIDEEKTLYLVEPGQVIITPDTSCKMLFSGDAVVTGARKTGTPELPWETGHVPPVEVKLKVFADIYTALNNQSVNVDGDAVIVFVSDRNLNIVEVDGWAIVQASLRFEWSEVIGG